MARPQPPTPKPFLVDSRDEDWWWYDDESDYTPVISGGLVATTRSWWQESGGFDPGMHGWGASAKALSAFLFFSALCQWSLLGSEKPGALSGPGEM